jgi:transposase
LYYKLVQDYDVIVVEHLSLKGMSQALNLGKPVMDLGYGAFLNKLRYKAQWHDKTVIVGDIGNGFISIAGLSTTAIRMPQ